MNTVNQIKEVIKKLKIDKKTGLIILIGSALIIILFLSELDLNNEKKDDNNQISNEEYCNYLETKVKNFIEKINGAGKAEVIITLAETTEYIYATDDKDIRRNNNNNDDSTLEKDYVIIENNNSDTGLLIKTIEPKIRGVAISCEGGDDINVQQQIYSTIEAILDVSASDISISKLSYSEE